MKAVCYALRRICLRLWVKARIRWFQYVKFGGDYQKGLIYHILTFGRK